MTSQTIIDNARTAGRNTVDEHSAKQLLRTFGISAPHSVVVQTASEARAAATTMSAPFVVKVVSEQILHKSDAGGVVLNLGNAEAAADAVDAMAALPAIQAAKVDGFLIEEMAPSGLEVVIGGVCDPDFGPLVMVGLGGVFVEVLQDVAFRICPIERADAYAMLTQLQGSALFDGARGTHAIDRQHIVDILLRVGGRDGLLMTHAADIEELDLNPIIATSTAAVAVDARIILSPPHTKAARIAAASSERRALDSAAAIINAFEPLFAPASIAVLGASTTQTSIANTFIRRLKAYGYAGHIYPIHPKAAEVEGIACYPNLSATPEPIDYAYIGISAERIPDALASANGNLKFAHVISSGFAEVDDGIALQAQLLSKAQQARCRVIGPNCLGLYSPRGGVTFSVDAPKEVGSIGVVSQSGGLGTDIIKRGQWRGVRFSGLVTVGNSADIGPVDLFEFYLHDTHTRAIGLYLEDIKDGRRFFELACANTNKPVVILRGGTSTQGKQAAASHTGALAGDERAWDAFSRQTGCVLVATVDEFINALLAFQFLQLRPNKPTQQIALFGNGGGTSVLATDYFASLGLDVAPFGGAALAELEALRLPPGTSVANPIDTPVATLQREEGRIADQILDIVYSQARPDAVVMHLNLASFVGRGDVDPVDNLIKAAVRVQNAYPSQAHFLMVLRVDGSPELDEKMRDYRTRMLAAGIAVFDELATAAKALAALSFVEHSFGHRLSA